MDQSLAYYVTLLRKSFVEYCNDRLTGAGLSQGQLSFILYVGKHPDSSPGELARALRMDMGQTTRTVARLVGSDFLTREPNGRDRRSCLLRLTERGLEVFRLSHDLFGRWEERVTVGLSGGERMQLLSLLKKTAQYPECCRSKEESDR